MIIFSLARGEEYTSGTFEEIYKRQSAMIYRVCFAYMKNAADAEDVVADIFAKLLKDGTTFKSAEHEKAWFLRTSINKCKDFFKHWWRSRANIDDYENLETANPFQENEVLKIILNLPERYKDVMYLYYYEGYSTAEVAQILKKPHSTVRYHMREARFLLRDILAEDRAPAKSVCDFVGKRSNNKTCELFGRPLSENEQSEVCCDEKGVLENEE